MVSNPNFSYFDFTMEISYKASSWHINIFSNITKKLLYPNLTYLAQFIKITIFFPNWLKHGENDYLISFHSFPQAIFALDRLLILLQHQNRQTLAMEVFGLPNDDNEGLIALLTNAFPCNKYLFSTPH